MKLDRTTYEAWLLDRIEGNLTPAQEQALDAFLAADPDLSAEGGPIDLPIIPNDEAGFGWKEELKKHYPPTGEPDVARIDDFLIARLEGELDPVRSSLLDRLLYEQPELQRNAKLIGATKSEVRAHGFSDKTSIARHFPPQGMPDLHRLDDFLVARLEGDLTLQQRAALDDLIGHDVHAAKQWAAMQHARIAKEHIVFEGKEQLKKMVTRVIPIGGPSWMKLAAAASIALVLGLGWMLLRNTNEPVVAEQTDPTVPVKDSKKVEQDQPANDGDSTAPTPDVDAAPKPGAVQRQESVPFQDDRGMPQQQPVAPRNEHHEVVPRQREEAPAMADVQRPDLQRSDFAARPVMAEVTTGVPPAPMDEPLAAAIAVPEHKTLSEFFAGTVRSEVLGQQPTAARVLDGNDAVAAIDKGLGAISAYRASLDVQRDQKRNRFRLQLGTVALSASRGR